jgi:hypothetical protein
VEGWYYGGFSATASFLTPPLGYETSPVPTIDNAAPKVGDILTSAVGAWTPAPATVVIRWYRSGKAISGATKATYKVTKADYKKAITVKVTASGSGYQTVTRTSLPTTKVTK